VSALGPSTSLGTCSYVMRRSRTSVRTRIKDCTASRPGTAPSHDGAPRVHRASCCGNVQNAIGWGSHRCCCCRREQLRRSISGTGRTDHCSALLLPLLPQQSHFRQFCYLRTRMWFSDSLSLTQQADWSRHASRISCPHGLPGATAR